MEGAYNEYAEFVGDFAPRYQRNNKRSGIKNLRCFPRCSLPHRTQGFCGQPVLVKFKIPISNLIKSFPSLSDLDFTAVAMFKLKYDDSEPREGHQLTNVQLHNKLRVKESPMNPWISGIQTKIKRQDNLVHVEFEFNSVKKGWHYGWVSNKHTCEALHCLKVCLYASSKGSSALRCICTGESPSFKIFCRRRSRPVSNAARAQQTLSTAASKDKSPVKTDGAESKEAKPLPNTNSNIGAFHEKVPIPMAKHSVAFTMHDNPTSPLVKSLDMSRPGVRPQTKRVECFSRPLLEATLPKPNRHDLGESAQELNVIQNHTGQTDAKSLQASVLKRPYAQIHDSRMTTLEIDLVSILSKLRLGTDGIFYTIPGVSLELISVEVLSCFNRLPRNKKQRNDLKPRLDTGDIWQTTAPGVMGFALKQQIVLSLARFLRESSSFIEAFMSFDATSPPEPLSIYSHFVQVVNQSLPDFFMAHNMNLDVFRIHFNAQAPIMEFSGPGNIANSSQPVNTSSHSQNALELARRNQIFQPTSSQQQHQQGFYSPNVLGGVLQPHPYQLAVQQQMLQEKMLLEFMKQQQPLQQPSQRLQQRIQQVLQMQQPNQTQAQDISKCKQ